MNVTDAREPLEDPRREIERVLDAAARADVVLRATGGLAVYLCCPSARRPPLARSYKDIDLVAAPATAPEVTALVAQLGYRPDEEFNALHGGQRLYFWDTRNRRQLDVFMGRMVMCHELDVGPRLLLGERTLPVADLLLSKLQVVEVNDKDLGDAAALLADHEIAPQGIDPVRVAEILSSDWGWWRTATATLARVVAYARRLEDAELARLIGVRAEALGAAIQAAPKSLRWRMRARIGERVRWYELPEEVEG